MIPPSPLNESLKLSHKDRKARKIRAFLVLQPFIACQRANPLGALQYPLIVKSLTAKTISLIQYSAVLHACAIGKSAHGNDVSNANYRMLRRKA